MEQPASDRRPGLSVRWTLAGLAVVLAAAAILRFWEIGASLHFLGDEGAQSAVEWDLIHGRLPLLGPSLSIGSMHLGPFFYYLAAAPLWIAGGSPVGPTVMVGLFGVAAVGLLFVYLRYPLGDWPALGASAVMATSFLMVEYSRRPWNPTPTPFFTLLFLWSLVLWKRHSSRYVPLTAGTLAILVQLQPVNVFLVALFVIFLVLARPPVPEPIFLAMAGALAVAILSPLIIYDLTHQMANTRAWIGALSGAKKGAGGSHASSPRVLFTLFNRAFEPRVIVASIILAVLLCLSALNVAFTNNDAFGANWEVLLPLLLLAIAAIGFQVYPKEVFEQYLVSLFVIPFIFLACLLRLLWRGRYPRLTAVALTLALVAIGVRDVVVYTYDTPRVTVASAAVISHDLEPDDTYGNVLKVSRVILSRARGRPFSIEMASPTNCPTGYSYVLDRLGRPAGNPELGFLLVEPPTYPPSRWTPRTVVADRRKARAVYDTGIVKVYELARPASVPNAC